jgi:hypothetical protein
MTSLFIRTELTSTQKAIRQKREGEREVIGGHGRVGGKLYGELDMINHILLFHERRRT